MALNSHLKGPAVAIVGQQGCGKSSLLTRFTEQTFNDNCLATLGIDVLYLGEQQYGLKPSFWDASGHPRFAHIVRGYLGGARAALLVYDVTNRASLESTAAEWLTVLREEAPADLLVILVGAKADCTSAERQVTPQDATAFAERHSLNACLEASAKTGAGVAEVFEELFDLLRSRERPLGRSGAAASSGASAQEEPLIFARPSSGSSSNNNNKAEQWRSWSACFSAIGQLLCRRTGVWR